jgi:heptaprenyl diphosphate synthase
VAEVRAAFQVGRTEDDYSNAIAGKTASLMATSCRIGALTGGLPRPQIDAFTTFGRYFGMIFQVRDDILDVVGTEAELGKPAGQDLAEGIYTLPVLLALADPVAGPELSPLLGQPLGQPERDKARSIVAESGAIEGSVVVARRYAELAAAAATSGPSAELATGFAKLAHSLVDGLPTA